jgi:malonate-semialdehyde dehydrogenase (acetylating) / methylmalonate-semialdehyde dehydrogenase
MPVAEQPDVKTLDNFIGGRWVTARATEFFDVHNPAIGDVIGRTPLSTIADVDAAVQAVAGGRGHRAAAFSVDVDPQ